MMKRGSPRGTSNRRGNSYEHNDRSRTDTEGVTTTEGENQGVTSSWGRGEVKETLERRVNGRSQGGDSGRAKQARSQTEKGKTPTRKGGRENRGKRHLKGSVGKIIGDPKGTVEVTLTPSQKKGEIPQKGSSMKTHWKV